MPVLACGVDRGEEELVRLAMLDCPFHGGGQALPGLGGEHFGLLLVGRRRTGGGEAEDSVELLGPDDLAGGDLQLPASHLGQPLGRLELDRERPKALVGRAELIGLLGHALLELGGEPRLPGLRVLELLNVGVGAEPSDDGALRTDLGDGAGLEPAVPPIVTADAELGVEGGRGGGGGAPSFLGQRPVVGVQLLEPGGAELLFGGDAGVVDPLLAEVVALTVAVAGPHQVGDGLDELLEGDGRATLREIVGHVGAPPIDADSTRARPRALAR